MHWAGAKFRIGMGQVIVLKACWGIFAGLAFQGFQLGQACLLPNKTIGNRAWGNGFPRNNHHFGYPFAPLFFLLGLRSGFWHSIPRVPYPGRQATGNG